MVGADLALPEAKTVPEQEVRNVKRGISAVAVIITLLFEGFFFFGCSLGSFNSRQESIIHGEWQLEKMFLEEIGEPSLDEGVIFPQWYLKFLKDDTVTGTIQEFHIRKGIICEVSPSTSFSGTYIFSLLPTNDWNIDKVITTHPFSPPATDVLPVQQGWVLIVSPLFEKIIQGSVYEDKLQLWSDMFKSDSTQEEAHIQSYVLVFRRP